MAALRKPLSLKALRSKVLGSVFGLVWSPSTLFSSGEQGAWYDPSDFSTMFQDSAGTTPVTAVEQPVGLIRDKSGRGNHASQSTAASRPVLSARVNQLTYTEDFSNAAWTKAGTTVAASVITATAGAGRHQVRQGLISSATAKASIQFSPGTHLYAHLCFYDGGAVYATAIYQLQGAGTVSQTANSSGTVASSTITLNANGSYTCTLSTTFTSAPVLNLSVGFAQQATGNTIDSSGIPTFTAAGTETISATYADARVTNAGVNLPAYQRVAAATDYDTSGFPLYLKFDGVDDGLATGTIDPGSVDKAQVFAGVRKLSDAAYSCLYELSSSFVGNNGVFVALPSWDGGAGSGAYWTISSKGTIGTSLISAASYAAPQTIVHTHQGDISGDRLTLRANGTQIASSTADQGTGNFLAYPLYIGRRGGSSLPFNGQVYSMIVRFSAANLSDAQIASTETYVNSKTGAY